MKSKLDRYIWPAYVAALFLTAGGTLIAAGTMSAHTGDHESAPASQEGCPPSARTIMVEFSDTAVLPGKIMAHRCDKLTVHNIGNHPVEIAFGVHEKHVEYPGLADESIEPKGTTEITLIRSGTFIVHDHLRDITHAAIIIEP